MPYRLLLATTLLAATVALPAGTPSEAALTTAQDKSKKLRGVLRAWLKAYRRGDFPVGDDYSNIAGKSLGRRAGLITKDMFQRDNGVLRPGQFSHREEIETLLAAAGKVGSLPMARELLPYCAIGLDDVYTYTPGMVPFTVRGFGEQALHAIDIPEVASWLAAWAAGEAKAGGDDKKLFPALRAAALRALAARDPKRSGAALQAALRAPERIVRLCAAEALGQTADAAHLTPMVEALAVEPDEFVERTMHLWIARLINSCDHKVDAAPRARAEDLLANALGRPGASWHHQVQLVELVDFYNRPEFVPELIGILESFVEHPEWLAQGRLSGILRNLTHQKLTGLTDTYHGIDELDRWQRYWARERAGFKVAAVTAASPALRRQQWAARERQRRAAAGESEAPGHPARTPSVGMSAGEFFGIPVQGSKVVFVIDSGAGMQRPVPLTTKVFTGRWPAAATRLEVARLEATRAIGGLTEDTRFNVITYSDGIKTAFEHLALADRKTVAAAIKFVGRQTPLRNYNFAAALIAALGANTSALGKPGNDVDEVFIVYNQLQQAGPVKDPDDILRFAHELARSSKVRINTVFLGSVDDEVDPRELGLRTMRELASITGGRFVRP